MNVECKDRIESEIILKNIKNQNRAGKGKKLINLDLDDYIKSIK
nr:hypothetical protein [Clostridium haemolyticum]